MPCRVYSSRTLAGRNRPEVAVQLIQSDSQPVSKAVGAAQHSAHLNQGGRDCNSLIFRQTSVVQPTLGLTNQRIDFPASSSRMSSSTLAREALQLVDEGILNRVRQAKFLDRSAETIQLLQDCNEIQWTGENRRVLNLKRTNVDPAPHDAQETWSALIEVRRWREIRVTPYFPDSFHKSMLVTYTGAA